MARDYSDELLSAYLDGELAPAERALVEERLAASENDRQMLAELRMLRSDLAALPSLHVDATFADRVVRAALAAQVADVPPPLAVAPRRQSSSRLAYAAAAMLVAAASLLVAVQPWRGAAPDNPAVALSPAEQLIASLRSVAPAEGQALVVRLQLPTDAEGLLDQALQQAGIPAQASTGSAALSRVYRDHLGEKLTAATALAQSAVFVEAPLQTIERAMAAVANGAPQGVQLLPEAKLDWRKVERGEGERDPTRPPAAPRPFAQRLDAAQFPLSVVEHSATAAAAPLRTIDAAGQVRVIILVEQIR